jgi:hypothetical protein
VVTDLQSVDFEIRFVREDIRDRYTDVDFEEAYKVIMGHLVASDDFESLIGEQACRVQTLFFTDIIVFIIPSTRHEAVFASFDYDEDFPVNQFVQQISETAPGE